MSKYRSNQFNKTNNIIKTISKLGNFNSNLFELSIFSRIENFLKVICLRIYLNNDGLSKQNNITRSYLELLDQLGMLDILDGDEKIKKEYLEDTKINKRLLRDYNYVVNSFINKKTKFKTNLSEYLLSLIEYLLVLEEISLEEQVDSKLSESFYSDLGSQAFELFNKKNFEKVVEKIPHNSILDIGCGNGNFIDYFIQKKNVRSVVGIEMQTDLAHFLQNKYSNESSVEIYSKNILELSLDKDFDLMNMSYMLFYLSYQDQHKLFSKLSNSLTDDGSIIICQYFGNIEEIQIEISKKYQAWGFIDRYRFSISQNVLYSELLLNASLSSFDTFPQYDNFLKVLEASDFEIKEIFPADNNFYSFYFRIGKK